MRPYINTERVNMFIGTCVIWMIITAKKDEHLMVFRYSNLSSSQENMAVKRIGAVCLV